jgi:DNA-binding transcriptional LysR family regulator
VPADLQQHACLALLTLERDVHDEWRFARSGAREKIKFASRLTAHGDELREAALAGCGIARLLACHVEDELRSGTLAHLLPDWECLGGLPIVAIYRKTKPRLSPINAIVSHLAHAFRRYDGAIAAR